MAITAPGSVTKPAEQPQPDEAARKPAGGTDRPGMDLGGASNQDTSALGDNAQTRTPSNPAGTEQSSAEATEGLRR